MSLLNRRGRTLKQGGALNDVLNFYLLCNCIKICLTEIFMTDYYFSTAAINKKRKHLIIEENRGRLQNVYLLQLESTTNRKTFITFLFTNIVFC